MAKKKRIPGELTCTATENGKPSTLDPIRTHIVAVELNEVASTLTCGFRQLFISGEKDGKEFSLTSGAGCGSKWMTFDYLDKQYTIDAEQLLNAIFVALEPTS